MAQDRLAGRSSLPPLAEGLPYLGSALDLRIDPTRYLVDLYHRHGAVFRFRLLGQIYWVMAGIDANRFLAREGDAHFSSEKLFGSMGAEMGADAYLVAMDGAPHRHFRKVMRRGYSREAIATSLPAVLDIAGAHATAWAARGSVALFPAMQRLVTDQLGLLTGGRVAGEYFDDLRLYLNVLMKVLVLKTRPAIAFRTRAYRAAKQRTDEFITSVLDWHRANPPIDREPRLIDDLITSLDDTNAPYSDATILAAVTGAYFAGMDTVASSLSFMLYAILTVPNLMDRVRAEVDAAFETGGGLTADTLRHMPTLHDIAIETLRLYPVAPFTPRTVAQAFEFGGYQFPVGTEVYIGNTITHFLPEHYPDPYIFDIDRFARPDQPKIGQAYAPFTLGAHTCLGAGMAEVQMMATAAMLVRSLDFSLDPANPPPTIYAAPLPNLGTKFAIQIHGVRTV
ncbi:MAG: cytochrome P450 [Chloroflexota bacterium]|nr:cytochrome P450 [Chloroflexota bacterium]